MEEKSKDILTLEIDISCLIYKIRYLDNIYNFYIYSSMIFQFLLICLLLLFRILCPLLRDCGALHLRNIFSTEL